MRVINSLIIAFSTYSRIPTPRGEWTDENRKYVMCFFPLVGVCVAAALGIWLFLCERLALGGFLKGTVGAVIPLLITGGIHMDGFMDTSDALASWQPKERRLEILKDSHIGAFAAINASAYLLVMAGLISEADSSIALPLGACFVLSRALSAWAAVFLNGARPEGMLSGFARVAQRRIVSVSSALYGVLCALTWLLTGGWLFALCPAVAAASLFAYRKIAYKHFGGVTGDLAGWFLQITEILLIAAVIMGGRLL